MSVPTRETTFGTLKYDGQVYEIFSIPLGEKQSDMIREFKKAHNYGSSTASWIFNTYEWEIDDNKLFLTNVGSFLAPDDSEHNILVELFGTSKLLANWKDIKIKALVKKIDEKMLENSIKECQREVLRFQFIEGVLQSVNREIETYQMKVLRNYVED